MSGNHSRISYPSEFYTMKPMYQPIEFFSDSPYYREEILRPLMTNIWPLVQPDRYYVSNYGKVYDSISDKDIYPVNGGRNYKIFELHRADKNANTSILSPLLILMHFKFICDCDLYDPVFRNGNQDDLHIWNLDWKRKSNISTVMELRMQLRDIAAQSTEQTLLTTQQLHLLYNEAVGNQNITTYRKLGRMFGVSIGFIDNLVKGYVHPYIRAYYVPREDVATAELAKKEEMLDQYGYRP